MSLKCVTFICVLLYACLHLYGVHVYIVVCLYVQVYGGQSLLLGIILECSFISFDEVGRVSQSNPDLTHIASPDSQLASEDPMSLTFGDAIIDWG